MLYNIFFNILHKEKNQKNAWKIKVFFKTACRKKPQAVSFEKNKQIINYLTITLNTFVPFICSR
jgi:hypothetical protein